MTRKRSNWIKIGFCFGLLIFIALSVNVLTYNACVWSGRLESAPRQGLPVWPKKFAYMSERQSLGDRRGKMVWDDEDVARLRRQTDCQSSRQTDPQQVPVDCESPRLHEAYQPTTRHTVIEWDSFDDEYSFSSFMNTQGQPAERRHGSSERDYVDMKEAALQLVNNRDHKNLRLVKVVHGYKRTDSLRGTEYILDLFLALPSGAPVSQRLHLVRPYREMMIESVQTYTDLNLHISLIMPLSNRLEIFKQFMYRFRKCCIGQKFVDVFLVIVYFGKENLIELKELLGK